MSPARAATPSLFATVSKSQHLLVELLAFQDELSAELADKEEQVGALTHTHEQLVQLQRQLDDLHRAQRWWSAERQAIINERDQFRRSYETLKQSPASVVPLPESGATSPRADEAGSRQAEQLEQLQQELAETRRQLDLVKIARSEQELEAVARLDQLRAEWQEVQVRLTEEKGRLADQVASLQQQLQAAREERGGQMEGLPAQFQAERNRLEAQLQEARSQLGELQTIQEERRRLDAERSAVLTQLQAMEQNWYGREIALAQERAAWEQLVDDANAKYFALQQDYQKSRDSRRGFPFLSLVAVGLLCLAVAAAFALLPLALASGWVHLAGAGVALLLAIRFLAHAFWQKLEVRARTVPAALSEPAIAPAGATSVAVTTAGHDRTAASPVGKEKRAGKPLLTPLFGAALLFTVLPILAILRGFFALLSGTATYSGAASAGLILAFIALFMGSIFFAYSIRYYIGTAVVLLASVGMGKNGNGNGNGHGNGAGNGMARISHPGQNGKGNGNGGRNGNGNGNGNGHFNLGYEPFVSVHVATYNEKRVIERLLEACAKFEYGNYEVVVVDDSTDETTQILERWKDRERFKIVHRPNRDGFKGGALQVALQAMDAQAEYVVVLDADSIPFPDTIQRFVSHFYEKNGNGHNGNGH